MTDCTKYKVISLFPRGLGAQTIEDWLNEQMEDGLEFVAVDGDKYIFKRNAYLVSIKKVEDYDNDYESH
jgi:hypothetical protein